MKLWSRTLLQRTDTKFRGWYNSGRDPFHLSVDSWIYVIWWWRKWYYVFLGAPWTLVCSAPLSMEFSRQKYQSGLPFPSPWDLPDPGIKPMYLHWQVNSLPLSHQVRVMEYLDTHTHTHTGILFSHKKEWNYLIYYFENAHLFTEIVTAGFLFAITCKYFLIISLKK